MGFSINSAGTWKGLVECMLKNGGAWNQVKEIYVRNAGAWKTVYKYVEYTIDQSNVDLFSDLGSPTDPVHVVVRVKGGVTINSTDPTVPAFDVGAFPSGSYIHLINDGSIIGAGGAGGASVIDAPGLDVSTPGQDGGGAISTSVDIYIDNTNGVIFGGGGGGGASTLSASILCTESGAGGGGGAGSVGGAGGSSTNNVTTYTVYTGNPGSNGGSVGGAGGTGYNPNQCGLSGSYTGDGGKGGDYGQDGSVGENSAYFYINTVIVVPGKAGGLAGKAVELNGNSVTWVAGNTSDKVKGPVS